MKECPACDQPRLVAGGFCGACGARLVPEVRSSRRRWALWGVALLWGALTVIICVTDPVESLGYQKVTLVRYDPTSVVIISSVLGLALAASGVDLLLRTRRHIAALATGALSSGAALIMFSLFGLLWGLASMGVCGALIVLSSIAPAVTAQVPLPA